MTFQELMGLSGACFFLVLPCSLTLILCLFIGFVLIQKDRRQAGRWVSRHLLGSGTPAFPRIPVGFLGEFRRTEAGVGWGGVGHSGFALSDPHRGGIRWRQQDATPALCGPS